MSSQQNKTIVLFKITGAPSGDAYKIAACSNDNSVQMELDIFTAAKLTGEPLRTWYLQDKDNLKDIYDCVYEKVCAPPAVKPFALKKAGVRKILHIDTDLTDVPKLIRQIGLAISISNATKISRHDDIVQVVPPTSDKIAALMSEIDARTKAADLKTCAMKRERSEIMKLKNKLEALKPVRPTKVEHVDSDVEEYTPTKRQRTTA